MARGIYLHLVLYGIHKQAWSRGALSHVVHRGCTWAAGMDRCWVVRVGRLPLWGLGLAVVEVGLQGGCLQWQGGRIRASDRIEG
jgi:hypothetical protein